MKMACSQRGMVTTCYRICIDSDGSVRFRRIIPPLHPHGSCTPSPGNRAVACPTSGARLGGRCRRNRCCPRFCPPNEPERRPCARETGAGTALPSQRWKAGTAPALAPQQLRASAPATRCHGLWLATITLAGRRQLSWPVEHRYRARPQRPIDQSSTPYLASKSSMSSPTP